MLNIVILISIIIFSLYFFFLKIRRDKRVRILSSVDFNEGSFDEINPGFKINDLADFLLLPIKLKRGYKKLTNDACFFLLDATSIVARGPYSGPTQTTYFIAKFNNLKVPDFKLRSKRLFETSMELANSKFIDENKKIVIWSENDGFDFVNNSQYSLGQAIFSNKELVIKGVNGCLVFWHTQGSYVSNSKVVEFILNMETVCKKLIEQQTTSKS